MNYNELLSFVKSLMCLKCHGAGKLNDAESGDIYYNIVDCHQCNGTGIYKNDFK